MLGDSPVAGRGVLSLAFVTLTVLALVAPVAAAPAEAPTNSTASPADAASDAPPNEVFSVVQGQSCYTVRAFSNSLQSVEDFYDYRNPYPRITGNPSDSSYSSFGTRRFQENQVSVLLFYRGSRGSSMVMVHDAMDEPNGSTVTFEFEGLPSRGEWAVQDDEYPGRDDEWDVGGTSATVTWKWEGGRNDGGAYRGLGGDFDGITVRPRFNENASAWGEWSASGTEANRMRQWKLVGFGGKEVVLDMDRPIRIYPGSCSANAAPSAALTAENPSVPRHGTVTLDASRSTDDRGIRRYRWDFDGDGRVDRETSSPTVDHTFDSAGTYSVGVTVVDVLGGTATASTEVRVGQSDRPSISLVNASLGPGEAVAGEPFPVRVTYVNDGGGAGTAKTRVRSDGSVVGSRTIEVSGLSTRTQTVAVVLDEPGTHELTIDGETMTVEVSESNPEKQVQTVEVSPASTHEGGSVTVKAVVANVGNADGTFAVDLIMFGEQVDSKEVTIPNGETRTVTFEQRIDSPGTYTAQVGDESATVQVEEGPGTATNPSNDGGPSDRSQWIPLDGFTVVLALAGVLVAIAGVLAAYAVFTGR